MVTIFPSTVGDQPTRGAAPGGPPGPGRPCPWGLSFAIAALPALFSAAQSNFCSEARSLGRNPSSFMNCRESSLDCSLPGILPPPPDCAEARWNRPAAEGIPIRQVTLEPPPDCP